MKKLVILIIAALLLCGCSHAVVVATDALKEKYADVIAKRKQARARINELEELIEALDSPTEETAIMDGNPSSEVDENSGEEVN